MEWTHIEDELPPKSKGILLLWRQSEGGKGYMQPVVGEWLGKYNDDKSCISIDIGDDDFYVGQYWCLVDYSQFS